MVSLGQGQEPIKREYREARPAQGRFLMGGSPGGKLPVLPLKGALTYITFACLITRPGQNLFPQLPSLTSRSQSSGEGVPRWGSLALSNSCVRRARGSCWAMNGCWRIEEGSGWSLVPRPLLSSIEPPAPAPSPASHLQKLLGCWPLLGVLGQGQLEEVVEILGPSGHKSPHTPGPG